MPAITVSKQNDVEELARHLADLGFRHAVYVDAPDHRGHMFSLRYDGCWTDRRAVYLQALPAVQEAVDAHGWHLMRDDPAQGPCSFEAIFVVEGKLAAA